MQHHPHFKMSHMKNIVVYHFILVKILNHLLQFFLFYRIDLKMNAISKPF